MEKKKKKILFIFLILVGLLIVFDVTFIWLFTYKVNSNDSTELPSLNSSYSPLNIGMESFYLILINIIIVLFISLSILKIVHQDYNSFQSREFNLNNLQVNMKKILNSHEIIDDLIYTSQLMNSLTGDAAKSKLKNLNQFKLTIISKEFMRRADALGWQDNEEKKLFIKEMVVLTPQERNDLLTKMEMQSQEIKREKP